MPRSHLSGNLTENSNQPSRPTQQILFQSTIPFQFLRFYIILLSVSPCIYMVRKSMYILNLNQHMPIFYNIFLYFHLAQVQQYLQLLFFLILHICK